MFTGLIQESARVLAVHDSNRLIIEATNKLFFEQLCGASIAVNGVCLTLVEIQVNADKSSAQLSFDVSSETLKRSNLGNLGLQSFVHLELPLQLGSFVGGHLVSGHVDGVCEVSQVNEIGDYIEVHFCLNGITRNKVAPLLVEKGSVALDGVSLTVNQVIDSSNVTEFEVMLIPHTLSITWPEGLKVGQKINIEGDLMAKHFVRFQTFNLNQSLPTQKVEAHLNYV